MVKKHIYGETVSDSDEIIGFGPHRSTLSKLKNVVNYKTDYPESSKNTNLLIGLDKNFKYIETNTQHPLIVNTDPIFVLDSTSCEQIVYHNSVLGDTLGNSGKRLNHYSQTNPNSTEHDKTEKVDDLAGCPLPNTEPNYVLDSSYCETINYYNPRLGSISGNSGKRFVFYSQTNPYSTATNKTEKVDDLAGCPLPNTDPVWVEDVSGSSCELIPYGHGGNTVMGNSGVRNVRFINTNPYSSEGAEFRIVTDTVRCPIPNTEPNWVNNGYTCEKDSNSVNTGNKIVREVDTNRFSKTYMERRTVVVSDNVLCPIPSLHTITFTIESESSTIEPEIIAAITPSPITGAEDNPYYFTPTENPMIQNTMRYIVGFFENGEEVKDIWQTADGPYEVMMGTTNRNIVIMYS